MQGIADGAGVDLVTILTLNCRSEIMFAKAKLAEDACTTIGVPPEASASGHTYLAPGIGTGGPSVKVLL